MKDKVFVDCSLMPKLKAQAKGGSLFDSINTVGIACNCDSGGLPVAEEAACSNEKCEWQASLKFCAVKRNRLEDAF